MKTRERAGAGSGAAQPVSVEKTEQDFQPDPEATLPPVKLDPAVAWPFPAADSRAEVTDFDVVNQEI